MRQTSDLITASRLISRNQLNADGTFGVSDDEVLQYLNDGQDRMQSLICGTKNIAKIFTAQTIQNVNGNQEDYDVGDRVLLNKQLEYVEFSMDGQAQNYIRLEKLNYFNRDSYPTTYPYGYIKTGGLIKLCPVPSSTQGTLRISYERELDDLVPRFGTVLSVNPTQLVLTDVVTAQTPTVNSFVCVVDIDGNRLATNIPISIYGGNVITTAGIGTYLATGKVLNDLVNGYVTVGRYSTAVSQLPSAAESYLIHYAAAELFHRDSSNDYSSEAQLVASMEADIIKAYASQTGEIQFTPQLARYEWW